MSNFAQPVAPGGTDGLAEPAISAILTRYRNCTVGFEMKYLFVLLVLVVIGLSLVAPGKMDLFPERPYSGAYAGN